MDDVQKPFVSVIIPCYNEEAILQANVNRVIEFLQEKSYKYQWEIILVNDGSKDNTGKIADELAN